MERRTRLEVGQAVDWQYPHDDIPSGRYVVVKPYPATSGSGTYVSVAKELGQAALPALPEELTVLGVEAKAK